MGAKAVYVVTFGDLAADSFEESGTGMLDLHGIRNGEAAGSSARRDAADRAGSTMEAELPFQDWHMTDPLYEAETARPRIWRIGKPGASSGQLRGFLARYAVWRSAMLAGNYSMAAELILKSKKLRPYLPILSNVAGKSAILVLGLYWLAASHPQKEIRLAAHLAGEAEAEQPLAPLVEFARSSFKSRDLPSFRRELAAALEAELVGNHARLVLGLVAENFGGRVLNAIRDQVRAAREEGLRRSLVEGLSGTEERIRARLESHEFILAREPWNKGDPNAIQVLLRKPGDQHTWLAGYLRRGVAAELAPMADRGIAFSARLFMLSGGECDLRVEVVMPGSANKEAT